MSAQHHPRRPARTRTFCVSYEIRSGIDDQRKVVWSDEVDIAAANEQEAAKAAEQWVEENDYHFDDRLDPLLVILGVAPTEDD